MGPAVSICRKNLFFNNNTTPVNSLSWEPLREFTGVVLLLKNRFLRQIETAGWPIFDQVGRPSRLVLGKKFFWIWFIYALEGIVLALQFFFLTKSHLKHPNVYTSLKPVFYLKKMMN